MVGRKLEPSEEKKVLSSLGEMKKKYKRSSCRKCGEEISFKSVGNKQIPHDIEGEEHWKTCPYSTFAQKKAAFEIVKKLGVLFIVKIGLNLEEEAGLTKYEGQVIHSILERAFREDAESEKKTVEKVVSLEAKGEQGRVDDGEGLTFKPEKTDPIGDPDEDLAPSEEAVHVVEEILVEKDLPAEAVNEVIESAPAKTDSGE